MVDASLLAVAPPSTGGGLATEVGVVFIGSGSMFTGAGVVDVGAGGGVTGGVVVGGGVGGVIGAGGVTTGAGGVVADTGGGRTGTGGLLSTAMITRSSSIDIVHAFGSMIKICRIVPPCNCELMRHAAQPCACGSSSRFVRVASQAW